MKFFYLELTKKDGTKFPVLLSNEKGLLTLVSQLKHHHPDIRLMAWTFKLPNSDKLETVQSVNTLINQATQVNHLYIFKMENNWEGEEIDLEKVEPTTAETLLPKVSSSFLYSPQGI